MSGSSQFPKTRLGIIGGQGWLGHAIAAATVAAGCVDPAGLILSGRSERVGDGSIRGACWTANNQDLVDGSEIIVVSVRPDQFEDIRIDTRGKLVISVMAGVQATAIMALTNTDRVVRTMPNAAASVAKSSTPWFATESVTAEDKRWVQRLFAACGTSKEVPLESHIDLLTGITGSGAAYPALLMSVIMDYARAQGLPSALAQWAAQGVVADASQLLAGTDPDPAAIVQTMIDYDGIIAAGLCAMIRGGFEAAVAQGLDAAQARTASIMTQNAECHRNPH